MATRRIAVDAGATLDRESDSVASVSFWYIPGGCEYDRAEVVEVYFNDMHKAKVFADQNDVPPEMASLKVL